MAYKNYYQGNYPNYQQQQNYAYQMPQQTNQGLNWVQGESGAKSWLVGRGETVLLMDSENPIFYLKSSDQAGMPLPLRIFDYTERTQNAPAQQPTLNNTEVDFVTREEYKTICDKYEELKKMIDDMSKPKTTRKKEGSSDE